MIIGLLDKAKIAVDKYSDGEIEEQIKLVKQDYEMSKILGANQDFKDYLDTNLEKIYGLNTVTVTKLGLNYKIEIEGRNKVYTIKYDGTIKQANKIEKMETAASIYAKLDGSTRYLKAIPDEDNGYNAFVSSYSSLSQLSWT